MNKVRGHRVLYTEEFCIALVLGTFYARERSQLETSLIIDQNASTNSLVKRTASFFSLNPKDLPALPNDQSISTISGTLVSQAPMFKTQPQRRLQSHHRRRSNHPQQIKALNALEIDQIPSIPMPNLMDSATRTSPLPTLVSSIINIDTSTIESSNKHSYETQVDSNGINHHRLHTITDHFLRPISKNDIPGLRASQSINSRMPTVSNGNHKRPPVQRTNSFLIQQPLASMDSVLKERSVTIGNENVHHPDAMERVNHILKQLYLPAEKK
jgi:hypothetical protein